MYFIKGKFNFIILKIYNELYNIININKNFYFIFEINIYILNKNVFGGIFY